MMSRKLAIPLLGVLLWVMSIHAGSFAEATLLRTPETGIGKHTSPHHKSRNTPLMLPPSIIKINQDTLNRSIIFGSSVVNRMHRLETNLDWSNIHVQKGTPSHGQLIANAPEDQALEQGKKALIVTKATIYLMNNICTRYSLSTSDCARFISTHKLTSTQLQEACSHLQRTCSQEELLSKYRSLDGSCNHKLHAAEGESLTSYKRLMYPEYLDGIQEPRRALNKDALPSARKISESLSKAPERSEKALSLAVMQWGQFVEHDLSYTAQSKMVYSKKSIECCSSDGTDLSPRYIHPFCAPISVPFDDSYYSRLGIDCMPYVRSIPALRSDCSFGPIEQLNQATHFLDASQIYGSTIAKSIQLRSFTGGKLSMENEAFLPKSKHPTEDCQVDSDESVCFISGDSRVNLQPQLTVMHTLWHKEHNRVASDLAYLNPDWDDEQLYQEARRIVIAEIQHITYNEWIPMVLGKKYLDKLNRVNEFRENVDPSVSNSFATAAVRAIYSLLGSKLKTYTEDRQVNTSLSLKDFFNKPDIIEKPGYFNSLVRGLATQQAHRLSTNYAKDVSRNLFFNGHYGFDLLSLDIQRGRDHGLPTYPAFRTLCGLPEAPDFKSFLDVMSLESVQSLSTIYNSPYDVDLLVGGLLEKPDEDSLFGPTFSCIIADQFIRTRRGDRYFYSNEDQPVPFSKPQLHEIKKVTLARVICDNSDIERMQPNVFMTLSESNNLLSCDSEEIPRVNLKLWADDLEKYQRV